MRMREWLAMVAIVAMSGCGGGGGGESSSGSTSNATSSSVPITSIAGLVTDSNGAPIEGATVTAYLTNDHTNRATTTGIDGRYSFSGLPGYHPYGSYEVRVEKTGLGFLPAPTGNSATTIKADYNALYRMVIAVPSSGSYTITQANFTAFRVGDRRISLARTGQSLSYAGGDDAALSKGVAWPTARFADNGNGTVTDALTGLVWIKDAGCMNVMNWSSALTAANQLANGSCGLSDGSSAGDWRLPNIGELESLIDISRSSPALSTGHSFANVGATYWSSTTYRGVTADAWVIRFTDGRYINDSVGNFKTTAMNGVWAVKSAATAGTVPLPATGQFIVYAPGDDAQKSAGIKMTSPRFIDNGDGTLADTVTGLTWLKHANCIRQNWSAAIAAVNSLASGQCGLSDGSTAGQWRMPNRAELLSLVDRAETNQALRFNTIFYKTDTSVDQPLIFNSYIENELYWTSSTDVADVTQAWTVHSCDWGVYNALKTDLGYTLAVR